MSCVQHPPIDDFIDAAEAEKRSASELRCREVTTCQLHRRRCHRARVNLSGHGLPTCPATISSSPPRRNSEALTSSGCVKQSPIDSIVVAIAEHGRAFLGMTGMQHPPIDDF
jgi:hypothetical protein